MMTLWQREIGRLSIQVLQEFYVTVTRKLRPGLTTADSERIDFMMLPSVA